MLMHAAVQGRPRVSVNFQSPGERLCIRACGELLDIHLRPINEVQEVGCRFSRK